MPAGTEAGIFDRRPFNYYYALRTRLSSVRGINIYWAYLIQLAISTSPAKFPTFYPSL